MLKRIKVSNFKSFNELDVKIDAFSVLIGANAAGKSNFVSIFKFLNDIAVHGLENAISLQGGMDYVRNLNISTSKPLSIRAYIYPEKNFFPFDYPIGGLFKKVIYEFAIKFNRKKRSYSVVKETAVANCDLWKFKRIKDQGYKKLKKLGNAKFSFIRHRKTVKISVDVTPKELEESIPTFMKRPFFREEKINPKELIIDKVGIIPLGIFIELFLKNIAIFDVNPKLSKGAGIITGKNELEPDGRNLALVLKNVLMNENSAQQLFDLITDILPFVEGIIVRKFADKFLIPFLKESYCKEEIPASLISDGTVNLTAMILALYFDKKTFVIFEEPERNLHPYLISKIIDMMDDASKTMKKQIIITTHNPEVVKHSGIENILLVKRDNRCISRITKPVESKEVKIFLKNEMGLDELFVKDLLK